MDTVRILLQSLYINIESLFIIICSMEPYIYNKNYSATGEEMKQKILNLFDCIIVVFEKNNFQYERNVYLIIISYAWDIVLFIIVSYGIKILSL